MEKRKQKSLQSFNSFSKDDLEIIQNIAYHQVFEPFEISFGLKVVRETRLKIEKKLAPAIEKISPIKKKALVMKEKMKNQVAITKEKIGFWKKSITNSDNKNFSSWKQNYTEWGDKIKKIFFIQLDKGLNLVFERELENLVIKKANQVLDLQLKNIIEIQNLNRSDRKLLLKHLYPFALTFSGKLKKTINQTSNIFLGLVVASNIPFTGASVNLITTFKTIIYLSNRLHLLASIHGKPVICKEAMFFVATKIISSIIDYENNKDHTPLELHQIQYLFEFTPKSSLLELFKKSTIKDLYISVPFVGSLSLAKITLDEQSVTKLTLQLFCDYFDYQYLEKKYTKEKLEEELNTWRTIYKYQKKSGWMQKILKEITVKESKNPIKKIFGKLQTLEEKEQKVLEKINQTAKETYSQFEKKPKQNLEEFVSQFYEN